MNKTSLRPPHEKIKNRLLCARPELGDTFDPHIVKMSDSEAKKVLSYLSGYSPEDDAIFDEMSEKLTVGETGSTIYLRTIASVAPVMNGFAIDKEEALRYLVSICFLMERKSSDKDFEMATLESLARGIMVGFLVGNVETEEKSHLYWVGDNAEALAVHRDLLRQHRSISPRICQLAMNGMLAEITAPMVDGAL